MRELVDDLFELSVAFEPMIGRRSRGGVLANAERAGNIASRRTLQKAGFVPCAHLLTGKLSRN